MKYSNTCFANQKKDTFIQNNKSTWQYKVSVIKLRMKNAKFIFLVFVLIIFYFIFTACPVANEKNNPDNENDSNHQEQEEVDDQEEEQEEPKNANATITVNADVKYQYVRGFGGMSNSFHLSAAPAKYIAMQDIDTMFSPEGLGFKILRITLWPYDLDQITGNKIPQLSGMDNSIYYDIVKWVNSYGGYVLASPWTPPTEWKSNQSYLGNGYLLPQHYADYAQYLKNFCQKMYEQDAPIYAISIQNEPDYPASYDGCVWSAEEMRDFFKQNGHFTDGVPGYGNGEAIPAVLTMSGESLEGNGIIGHDASLDDPTSEKAIDIIGYHIYGFRGTRYANAINRGKETWMTEYNTNSGDTALYPQDSSWNFVWLMINDVHHCIANNDSSAFIWWYAKRFYSFIGDGSYGTVDGEILPRGYAISHFAKFATDTYRINLTASGTLGDGTTAISSDNFNNFDEVYSARVTAYISPDGNSISLVLFTPTDTSGNNGIDMGTIKIQLPEGFEALSATAMRSNSDVKAQAEEVILSSDGNSAYITLPASNILSVKFCK